MAQKHVTIPPSMPLAPDKPRLGRKPKYGSAMELCHVRLPSVLQQRIESLIEDDEEFGDTARRLLQLGADVAERRASRNRNR